MLDISVIVCTHSRPHALRALLETVCALDLPGGLSWEILVVDNEPAEKDANEAVASSFAGRLPLRFVREPAPGLCRARNRGVREARGRHICWTDDDTLLDRSWLSAYARAFARHPEAALFGGRILPRLEPPTPGWFARGVHAWPIAYVVAHRDMGDAEGPIGMEDGRLPWGANMAVRAEEQKRHLYDLELGLSPAHNRTGEETDLTWRILREGGTGWWVPDSKVDHLIPADRQTRDYIALYYERGGCTSAFLDDKHRGAGGVPFPLPFERYGSVGLAIASAAARTLSAAFGLAGLNGPALRFLARASYYRGIAAHRRETEKAGVSPRRPLEAGKAC
jgi:glycosyltransferase involved in cell wall biosynthesis